MRFLELRQAIIDVIQAEFSALKSVEAHPGRFDMSELKRIAVRLPAIRIAVMNVGPIQDIETNEKEVTLKLAAFVITSDKRKLPKDEAALAIVERLSIIIPGQRWQLNAIKAAKHVKADNLFNGKVDRLGVAMWALTWEQTIRIGEDVWGGGQLPSEVYLCDDNEEFGNEEAYTQVTS